MRKIISILSVMALLVMFSLPAMAATSEKLTITNRSGDNLYTVVPNSANADGRPYIKPRKHRVLRFRVSHVSNDLVNDEDEASENWAVLHDATTLGGATDKTAEGEIESEDFRSVEERYDRPLRIVNGVVLGQGAWTSLLIEYEIYQ